MNTIADTAGAAEPPNDRSSLAWCATCDRPVGLCECDQPRSAGRVVPPVDDRSTVAAPVGDFSTVGRGPVEPGLSAGHAPVEAEQRAAELTTGGKIAAWGLGVFAAALGLVGFAVSFDTVATAMEPAFNEYAFLVPTGVDLGIFVFAGLGLLLARMDMRLPWLRLVPWGLTAATVYLNVTAYDHLMYQVAHAVLPLLWVVVCEVVTHVVRVRVGVERGTHTDNVPLWRWLLAPWTTFKLWRVMRLWNITSYPKVLANEQQRLLAKTAMLCRYGNSWRKDAPAMLRARYRMRTLTETDVWAWQTATTRGTTDRPATGKRPASKENDRPSDSATGNRSGTNRPANRRTPNTRPPAASADRSTATGDITSADERLAAAYAKFHGRGVEPSGTQLATEANCSKTVANDWKKKRREGGVA